MNGFYCLDSQTSSWNDFICKDGTLVGKEAICDGKRDCADGFDEENCGECFIMIILLWKLRFILSERVFLPLNNFVPL